MRLNDLEMRRRYALQSINPGNCDQFIPHEKKLGSIEGWQSNGFSVYEYIPFPSTNSHRLVIPNDCSDSQVAILVNEWLEST